jgi:gamma-glutamylcyclotransferase (GGCT)/AIG2-like uncharacterized protein YtfP
MDHLFVYGSLQPGGRNEYMLAGLDGEWRPAIVRGVLLDRGWGADVAYPGLVIDDSGPPVPGLLFSSTGLSARLPALDEFEGESYERRSVTARLEDAEEVEAWVYAVRGET